MVNLVEFNIYKVCFAIIGRITASEKLDVVKPMHQMDKLTDFLMAHNLTLNAQWRIGIFKVKNDIVS